MILGPSFQNVIPEINIESARAILDKFEWNTSLQESNGQWLVFSGEVLLVSSEEKMEVDAFLVGIAFGLAILPPKIQDDLKILLSDK